MSNIKMQVVTWTDENPADDINEALRAVFNGRTCPITKEVHAGGSWHAVVVASEYITTKLAQQFYEEFVKSIG